MTSNTRPTIHDIIRDSAGTAHDATLTDYHPGLQRLRPSLPQVGLLYRTIAPSPIVKWILPARIRSAALNDVLFVGEDFVHVRTVLLHGELRHVASKTDFRSRIRSANVIGSQVAIQDPSIEPILDPIKDEGDIEPDDPLKLAIPSHLLVCAMEDGELLFIYVKRQPDTGTMEFIEIREPMPKERSIVRQPGARIVVDQRNNLIAVAAYMNTVMIYKVKQWDEIEKNLESYQQTPRMRNRLLPHSVPQWSPIFRGQAFAAVQNDPDATIMHIEFLYNDSANDHSPVLVLIVRSRNKTKLFVYQSNNKLGTNFAVPIINGQTLGDEASKPQLLVPFQNKSAFFLVCSTQVILCTNVLTQSVKYEPHSTHPDELSHAPVLASFAEVPAYTAWVYTARSAHSKTKESMFLLREDGYLMMIEAGASTDKDGIHPIRLDVCGRLLCNGASSLAYILLSNSLGDPETVIAGGFVTDGQVAQIGMHPHRPKHGDVGTRVVEMKLRILQTFPNWSPIMDCDVASTGPEEGESEGLFLTTGKQPHSCITEMKFGHEARVMNNAFLGEDNMLGVTGFWVLRVPSEPGIILYFISTPQHTEVFYFDTYEDEIYSLDHLKGPTLAVITLPQDVLLRVSPNSILLYHIRSSEDSENTDLQLVPIPDPKDNNVGNLTVAAAVPTIGSLIVSELESGGSRIGICAVQADDIPHWRFEPAKDLYNYTMTCLTVFNDFGLGFYALIGGPGGVRDCMKLNGPDIIRLKGKYNFSYHDSAPSTSAESLAVLSLSSLGTPLDYAVLCGTRQGSLQVFWLRIQEDSYELRLHETLEIGEKPILVQAVPEASLPVAFITSDNEIFRFELSKVGGGYKITTSPVWFNDSYHSNFPQPLNPLIHVNSISNYEAYRDPCNTIISMISAGNLSIAEVQGAKGPVPRKISLVPTPSLKTFNDPADAAVVVARVDEPGTPHVAVSLKDSDMIAIGASRWDFVNTTPANATRSPKRAQNYPNSRRQRLLRGVIYLVDKSVHRGGLDGEQAIADTSICIAFPPGERILAIHDWSAKVLNSSDHTLRYIMVGTSFPVNDSGEQHNGRLYFLLSKWSGRKLRQVSVQTIKLLGSPVKAIAGLDPYRLAILHGTSLQVWGLRIESGKPKFALYAETTLFSPGHKMTANWPYLYISTIEQSFVAYQYVETTGGDYTDDRKDELHKFFADSQSRQTTCHLPVQLKTPLDAPHMGANFDDTILLSDMSGGLTLLSHPGPSASRHGYSAPISRVPIISVTMPRMVSRLSYAPKAPRCIKIGGPTAHFTEKREQDLSIGLHEAPFVSPHVIGTSPSGAIIQIQMLNKDASILLKFLENLLSWFDSVKDMISGQRRCKIDSVVIDPLRRVTPTRGNPDHWPDDMAVNGDRLLAFTGEHGHDYLLEILWSWPSTATVCLNSMNDATRVGNDVASRTIRFVELVEKVAKSQEDGHEMVSHEWKEKLRQIWDDPLSMEHSIITPTFEEDPEKYFQLAKQEVGMQLGNACARCAVWLAGVLSDIL